jgi:hypothetical protein
MKFVIYIFNFSIYFSYFIYVVIIGFIIDDLLTFLF